MAAPSFVAAGTPANTSSGTSITPGKPAGLADGHVLHVMVGARVTGRTITVSGGAGTWVQEATATVTGVQGEIWTKRVATASGEPSTYTVGISGAATRFSATIIAVSGCDATTHVDAVATGASGTSATPTSNSLVTTVADTLLIWSVSGNFSTSSDVTGVPTGFTSPLRTNNSSQVRNVQTDKVQTTATTVSGQAGTLTTSENWVCFLIALRPVAAGGTAHEGAATINGTSSVTSVGASAHAAAATINSTSTVAAGAVSAFVSAATVAGVSSVTGVAPSVHPASSVVAGVSSVTAGATVGAAAAATVAGAATVTSVGTSAHASSAVIAGTSVVTASGNADFAGAAQIDGISSVTVAATVEASGIVLSADVLGADITWSWSAVDGAAFYHLQVDDNTGFTSPQEYNITAPTVEYLDAGRASGTYYGRVRAYTDV